MNIFLWAFIDQNFGDNYFVDTFCRRYPSHTFYIPCRKDNATFCQEIQHKVPNIRMVSEEESSFLSDMQGMILLGGDMFWDYGISPILECARVITQNGGWCIVLGASLFDNYLAETEQDLRQLFLLSHAVILRDRQSARQAAFYAPEANILCAADMAFQYPLDTLDNLSVTKGLLGISIRQKIPRNSAHAYRSYCSAIAQTIQTHLELSKTNQVALYAFSTGCTDDSKCAQDIIRLCPDSLRDRISCICFLGDAEDFLHQLYRCEVMICTRFHSLVFALIMKKPFVPIVYEDKIKHLLNEIHYQGPSPVYEDVYSPEQLLSGLSSCHYSRRKLRTLRRRAKSFFLVTDRILKTDEPLSKWCIIRFRLHKWLILAEYNLRPIFIKLRQWFILRFL